MWSFSARPLYFCSSLYICVSLKPWSTKPDCDLLLLSSTATWWLQLELQVCDRDNGQRPSYLPLTVMWWLDQSEMIGDDLWSLNYISTSSINKRIIRVLQTNTYQQLSRLFLLLIDSWLQVWFPDQCKVTDWRLCSVTSYCSSSSTTWRTRAVFSLCWQAGC